VKPKLGDASTGSDRVKSLGDSMAGQFNPVKEIC